MALLKPSYYSLVSVAKFLDPALDLGTVQSKVDSRWRRLDDGELSYEMIRIGR
jgi:hypothetical protein